VKQVYRIDVDNYYVEPVIIADKSPIPKDCREDAPPDGLYRAQRNNADTEWIEGASQEEIDNIRNTPVPLSELAQLKKQQTDLMFELMLKGVL
jgi:hypothetical protein